MKINNKLRLFGLLMALMAGGQLVGQDLKMNGFAGEDQSVYFKLTQEQPYVQVTLGSTDPATTDANCVFSWRVLEAPPYAYYILDNKNSNRPTLKVFIAGDYVIEATRVSKYGYQTEIVALTFSSNITLVAARSLKECWENGDDVSPSDFVLITDPPGFDYLVEVHPEDRIIGRKWNWYGNEEVRFRIRKPDDDTYQDCDVTANIFVCWGKIVDLSTNVVGLNGSQLPDNIETIRTLYQSVRNAKRFADRFNGLLELINSCSDPNLGQFHLVKKADLNMDMAIYMSCCEIDGQIRSNSYFQMGGTLDLFVGCEGRFPLYPPNPKFGLFVIISARAGVKADGLFQISTDCFDPGADFQAYVGGGLKVQAAALDPDVLSVDAAFYIDAIGYSQLRVRSNPMITFDDIYLYPYVKGSFTLIGFNVEFLNYSFEKIPLLINTDDN